MTRTTINLGARGAVIAAYIALAAVFACIGAVHAMADDAALDAPAVETTAPGGDFVKKAKNIRGGWEIMTRDDGVRVLRFDDAFRTANGPDLKVFLSPTAIAAVNGDTATAGSVFLGELQSNRGAQEYEIPADLDLGAFQSVLVHCEAFSKLWGGGAL